MCAADFNAPVLLVVVKCAERIHYRNHAIRYMYTKRNNQAVSNPLKCRVISNLTRGCVQLDV